MVYEQIYGKNIRLYVVLLFVKKYAHKISALQKQVKIML